MNYHEVSFQCFECCGIADTPVVASVVVVCLVVVVGACVIVGRLG